MKIKLVYSAVALFVMCNQSTVVAEEEQSDFSSKDVKPLIVLGYKPIISFYHPVPFTLGQLVPAGSPWPDSPEGYRTTLRPGLPPSLLNKFGKEGVESEPESPQKVSTNAKPATVLEYKPTRPSFLPESTIIGQLIPSGTPWPDSPQGYSTTLKPPLENKFQTDDNKNTNQKPAIVLEYKPTRPPHLPEPPTIGQLIPSGTPWPESPEGYQTTLNDTATKVKPATVLEYKPTRPSFLPEPTIIGQLIPSGTPWPNSPQGYSTTLKPPLENKFQTDDNKITKQKPAIVLEYKPTRPSFLPEPTIIGQLIPSGTPWPDSPQGYSTTLKPPLENKSTKQKPATVLEYEPTRPPLLPEPSIIGQSTGTPSPDSPQGYSTTLQPPLENKFDTDDNKGTNQKPATVLEYKPTRPSFLPEPLTIGQLIPPGKPWPASVDEYNTPPSQITNRFPEVTSKKPTIEVTQSTSSESSSPTTHIVLGYKPQRPWYVPDPVTIGQLIPPGKPWPASVDEYNTSTSPSQITTNSFPEVTSSKPTIQLTQSTSSESSSSTTHIVLGYKPQRPGFVPDPVTIGQLIPPGKPWPASVDEYNTPPSQITNRFPEVTSKKPTIQVTQSTSSESSSPTSHIVLGYKPQRPWYVPDPVTIGQIIPTGKPWPASAEGYTDFSAGKPGNSIRKLDEDVANSLP